MNAIGINCFVHLFFDSSGPFWIFLVTSSEKEKDAKKEEAPAELTPEEIEKQKKDKLKKAGSELCSLRP